MGREVGVSIYRWSSKLAVGQIFLSELKSPKLTKGMNVLSVSPFLVDDNTFKAYIRFDK
jgi:hypothetical protein